MCICIPNMKFLGLTLCQGELCIDDDANDDNMSLSLFIKLNNDPLHFPTNLCTFRIHLVRQDSIVLWNMKPELLPDGALSQIYTDHKILIKYTSYFQCRLYLLVNNLQSTQKIDTLTYVPYMLFQLTLFTARFLPHFCSI